MLPIHTLLSVNVMWDVGRAAFLCERKRETMIGHCVIPSAAPANVSFVSFSD